MNRKKYTLLCCFHQHWLANTLFMTPVVVVALLAALRLDLGWAKIWAGVILGMWIGMWHNVWWAWMTRKNQ